jgi:hypothetical protein
MKRKNDTGELHITELNQTEIHNPLLVLREFTEDFSLESVRQLITVTRDVCVTTENVMFGKAVTREDLLHVTRHMIRFFEAAYLYLVTPEPQDDKVIAPDFRIASPATRPKLMKVLERAVPSPHLEPYTFPCLILSGKWLEKAGFYSGNKVSIVHEHQKILITVCLTDNDENKELKRA